MREVTAPGRVSHTCSICGKIEPWSESWSWFGSYKELEDGKPILKFCSDVCKQGAIMLGKAPKEEEAA